MQNIIAKKSLGQNFLKSKLALLAMIKAGEITNKDTVLEIGPGQGALTEKLLETGGKVIAVEKDDRLIEFLNEKFANEKKKGQFKLIHDDILELDLDTIGLKNGNFKLIANIPYYITGLIFRKFLEGNIQPSKLVIMVQKEIADRIIARDEKESLLSLSVKAYGMAKKIMKVEKENFSPAPKVDSAILLVDNISKVFFEEIDEKSFFEVIKTGFAHKRKMLIANLKEKFGKNDLQKIFQDLKISEKTRSEDLKLENWKELIKKFNI
ncbi:MAG: 16S rRNA (adenine(1518)-N(6)/adenine(1519)-N(6))-dimethyltransferase RsmA [Candidatus Paceibacterota bacterium]